VVFVVNVVFVVSVVFVENVIKIFHVSVVVESVIFEVNVEVNGTYVVVNGTYVVVNEVNESQNQPFYFFL
jgi:hypothetical protein